MNRGDRNIDRNIDRNDRMGIGDRMASRGGGSMRGRGGDRSDRGGGRMDRSERGGGGGRGGDRSDPGRGSDRFGVVVLVVAVEIAMTAVDCRQVQSERRNVWNAQPRIASRRLTVVVADAIAVEEACGGRDRGGGVGMCMGGGRGRGRGGAPGGDNWNDPSFDPSKKVSAWTAKSITLSPVSALKQFPEWIRSGVEGHMQELNALQQKIVPDLCMSKDLVVVSPAGSGKATSVILAPSHVLMICADHIHVEQLRRRCLALGTDAPDLNVVPQISRGINVRPQSHQFV